MLNHLRIGIAVAASFLVSASSWGDGPADNRPDEVRPIPPLGMEVDAAVQQALEWRCKAIRAQWEGLVARAEEQSRVTGAIPAIDTSLASEVLVFPRAVEMALEFGQFYRPRDLQAASTMLDEAARRIALVEGGGKWADVVGLSTGASPQKVIGGYQSKLDGSYQPYGLVVPLGMGKDDTRLRRLDIWFHGRGETLSEVSFLAQQQTNFGQYTPEDTLVLHPYGRYSNAFKFAGEIDVLEVQQYIQDRLPIDPNRVSVRGFSMGGAACWQFATHYADRWFAANPGAGFSETPEFLSFFQQEDARAAAPEYQQKLWQLYDCPPWAINLGQCPTIAYSGELDRQKQAADVMDNALAELGIDLVHVIGPQTEHKIHPDSKLKIEARMADLAKQASPSAPRKIEFATVTLRYHRMHWVDVRGLEAHWSPASVSAEIHGNAIQVATENVNRIRFSFGPGQWPGEPRGHINVTLNGQVLEGPLVRSDHSWSWEVALRDNQWSQASNDDTLRKRPGLQGPIDDAFLESFLFVLPSGASRDSVVQNWVDTESMHAMHHWRKHFRGDVRSKLDRDVTAADIKSANLILFGDADSNSLITRIADQLPVNWSETDIRIGEQTVPRAGHVPALIYPNPLNSDRYAVVNSGFTFREYDYLNNARQTPKLPDWALIDVREGATYQDPGRIVEAGFFGEDWQPSP